MSMKVRGLLELEICSFIFLLVPFMLYNLIKGLTGSPRLYCHDLALLYLVREFLQSSVWHL